MPRGSNSKKKKAALAAAALSTSSPQIEESSESEADGNSSPADHKSEVPSNTEADVLNSDDGTVLLPILPILSKRTRDFSNSRSRSSSRSRSTSRSRSKSIDRELTCNAFSNVDSSTTFEVTLPYDHAYITLVATVATKTFADLKQVTEETFTTCLARSSEPDAITYIQGKLFTLNSAFNKCVTLIHTGYKTYYASNTSSVDMCLDNVRFHLKDLRTHLRTFECVYGASGRLVRQNSRHVDHVLKVCT